MEDAEREKAYRQKIRATTDLESGSPDDCVEFNPNLKEDFCGKWTSPAYGSANARAISTKRFSINGQETIVAAITRTTNVVRIGRYDPDPGTQSLSFSVIEANIGATYGEVDIEEHGGELVIVWKNHNGEIEEARMNNSGQITASQVMTDRNGLPWTTNTSPALALRSQFSSLYMLRTKSNDRLEILWRSSQGWRPSGVFDIPDTNVYRTVDRPGFAWQPHDRVNEPGGAGHFWIAFPAGSSRRLHSVRLPEASVGPALIGRTHHRWTYAKAGTSVSLLDAAGDSNMRAAYIRPDSGRDRVMFFPFADGIWDYDLEEVNDFEIMASGTCLGLMEDNNLGCGPLDGWPSALWGSYMFFDPVNNEDEPDCDL